MNIKGQPVAAEEGADDNFAGRHLRQWKNGQLHARKFPNEITGHQLRWDCQSDCYSIFFAYRLTLSINLELVSPNVAISPGVNQDVVMHMAPGNKLQLSYSE